ncbi:peroxisomal 2,4-dienoyl-CoA reductase [Thraustotheca clavata]|uniref:2,4-dienoyl-CoA reductase [(3E)-enoyl-CoA-producing] n=1 Tax=Thraustotheca clavata TaxID=74557 RepID=A0A1W0A6F6_9STRA|nr:peroxisomal 2,4-dienoyl-CoA reductase [Thraustotheca clavata]
MFTKDVCADRVVLVTGGGSGIGFAISRQMGLHGAKVVIMGRRAAVLQAAVASLTAEGIAATFVTGDVRQPAHAQAAIEKAVSTYGKLNVLVNCAAGNFLSTAEQLSTNAFRTVIEIDTVGTFNMCSAAFPQLKINGGVIINISAVLQKYATWYQVHASAAKAAIDSITRSLALEWGVHNIRVIGIAPGPISDTPGLNKLAGDAIEDMVKEIVPLKRVGTKDEIALIAVFALTPGGGYITGHTIIADGGQHIYRDPPMPHEMVTEWSRQRELKSKL